MAVPELWRTTKQRYSMRAEMCPHCEEAVFPPRAVCPHCRREMKTNVQYKAPANVAGREFVYAMPLSKMNLISGQFAVAGDD